MNVSDVKARVETEIRKGDSFENLHGVTRDSLERFLVEPYEVVVDPDDLESPTRGMWIVLHERPEAPSEGYMLAYDPATEGWSIVEHSGGTDFVQVVAARTLAGALEAM